MTEPAAGMRIDKWLWVARCFKTRSLASDACVAGHVKLEGESVKPAKTVRPGETVEVRTPAGLRVLEVVGLSERRGPAAEARALYLDHSPPPPPREVPAVLRERGAGRPSKKDRRDIGKLRGY